MNNAEITELLGTWVVMVVISAVALVQLQCCTIAGGTTELAFESVTSVAKGSRSFPVQTMQAYRGHGFIAPLILSLGTNWR
jgi:hypothetical protein